MSNPKKRFVGLIVLIALAIMAILPNWSLVGFAESLASNEAVARNIFIFLAIAIVAAIVVVTYKFLFEDNQRIKKREDLNNK